MKGKKLTQIKFKWQEREREKKIVYKKLIVMKI